MRFPALLWKTTNSVGFWIGVFFLVHFVGCWHPPLEAAHSWRQATGLMVARNYFEGHTTFFYPMVDETNGGSGIIGMEFPLLYYLHGKLSLLFGFHAGTGRLLNSAISTLGLAYFYALLLRFLSRKAAMYATLLLGVSCYFMYSRKVMPDTAALAIYLMGIFYFFEALRFGKWRDGMLSFSLLSLGLLLKISVLPLVAFGVFAYFHYRNKPKKAFVLLLPFLSLIPAFVWYFVWNPHLASRFGNWYNLGGGIDHGAQVFLQHPAELIMHVLFHPFFSYLAIALCVFGMFMACRKEIDLGLKVSIPVFVGLFVAYALKSGEIFLTHEYYILPAVPILAILAGNTLAGLKKGSWMLMVLISVEAMANQAHDFRYNTPEAYKLELSVLADRYIPNDALIVVNGNSNPQGLYFLHRKGWNLDDASLLNKDTWRRLTQQGCRYAVINHHGVPLPVQGRLLFENDHYSIYLL